MVTTRLKERLGEVKMVGGPPICQKLCCGIIFLKVKLHRLWTSHRLQFITSSEDSENLEKSTACAQRTRMKVKIRCTWTCGLQGGGEIREISAWCSGTLPETTVCVPSTLVVLVICYVFYVLMWITYKFMRFAISVVKTVGKFTGRKPKSWKKKKWWPFSA